MMLVSNMKQFMILAFVIFFFFAAVPCLAGYCDLTRSQRQQLIRVLSQAEEQNNRQQDSLLPEIDGRQMNAVEDFYETSKRGLDLGMARGFSGNQQGKSQVGLIAANMARGPGKRRRR